VPLQVGRPDDDDGLRPVSLVPQQSKYPTVDGVRGVDAVDAGRVQRAAVGDRVGLVVGEWSVGKQLKARLVERQAQRGLFGQLIE